MSTARTNPYPDLATTMAISAELVGSVDELLSELPAFFASPASDPVSARLSGFCATLNFMGLRCAHLALDQGARLAAKMEVSGSAPTEPQRAALLSVLHATHEYLGAAAAGNVKSGSALHAAVVLAAEQNAEDTLPTSAQMFLPVWPLHHDDNQPASESYEHGVAPYRAEIRAAMDEHIERPSAASLSRIRASLVTIETKLPPPQIRDLVSITIAYLDAAATSEDTSGTPSPELASVVDLVVQGASAPPHIPDTLVSSLLAKIAQHPDASERTRHFAELYDLERLASGGCVTAEQIETALEAGVRATRAWEDVVSDLSKVDALKETSITLAKAVGPLDSPSLRTLTLSFATLVDGIASGTMSGLGVPAVVDGTPTGATGMREDIAIFGASLVLGITDQIALISNGRSVDREIVDYFKQAVRSVLSGSIPTRARPANGHGVVFPELMEQAAETMKSIEAMVDLAFRGDSDDASRAEIDHNFTLVRSVLEFMHLGQAARLVEQIRTISMEALNAPSQTNADDRERGLAAPVMHMNSYLAVAAIAPRQAERLLLAVESALATPPDASSTKKESVENEIDVCADAELGPIFFGEARSVLSETIFPGLERLSLATSDRETLINVRRGFHTLKGSARMVGLVNLGKLAEAVEHSLNAVRDNKGMVLNPAMTGWIGQAANAFSSALDFLERNEPAPVDPRPFIEISATFRSTGAFSGNVENAPTQPPAAIPALHLDVGVVDAPEESHFQADGEEPSIATEQARATPAGADAAPDIAESPAALPPSVDAPAQHEDVAAPITELRATTAGPLSLAAYGSELDTPQDATTLVACSPEVLAPEGDAHMVPTVSTLSLAPAGVELDRTPVGADDGTDGAISEGPKIQAGSLGGERHIAAQEPSLPVGPTGTSTEDEPTAAPTPMRAESKHNSDDVSTADGPGHVASHADDIVTAATAVLASPNDSAASTSIQSSAANVVVIDDVTVPTDLFNTFVDEAAGYMTAMNETLANLVEGRTRRIDFEFYRMAHALTGMGRATGFHAVTQVAEVLEEWSDLNKENDIFVSKTSATMLTDAMRCLTWAIESIGQKQKPSVDRWVVDNMRNLISMNQQFVLPSRPEKTQQPSRPTTPDARSSPQRGAAKIPPARANPDTGGRASAPAASSGSTKAPQNAAARPARAPGSQATNARAVAPRKYKTAPAKPDTVLGAFTQMVGRAVRRTWNQVFGK